MPRRGHRGARPRRARRPAFRSSPQPSWRITPYRKQRPSLRPLVPIVVPDGGPERLLVREPAGPRVARQVVRYRRAAPLSEIPPDSGLLLGGGAPQGVVVQLGPSPARQPRVLPVQAQIVEELAERVRFGLPAGPAHHLVGDDEPLEVL